MDTYWQAESSVATGISGLFCLCGDCFNGVGGSLYGVFSGEDEKSK